MASILTWVFSAISIIAMGFSVHFGRQAAKLRKRAEAALEEAKRILRERSG